MQAWTELPCGMVTSVPVRVSAKLVPSNTVAASLTAGVAAAQLGGTGNADQAGTAHARRRRRSGLTQAGRMRPNRYLCTFVDFIGDSPGEDGEDGQCARMAATS